MQEKQKKKTTRQSNQMLHTIMAIAQRCRKTPGQMLYQDPRRHRLYNPKILDTSPMNPETHTFRGDVPRAELLNVDDEVDVHMAGAVHSQDGPELVSI
jgi:hypothetical protein